MVDRQADERAIFVTAIEIDSGEARQEYLDAACRDNPKLRADVDALLREHATSQGLLDVPDAVTATTDRSASYSPGASIGPYRLLATLGEGGMGVVFRAEQNEPMERQVALKIVRPGMDTERVIARFEAERHALAVMDHPNVAKVLDAGTTQSGRPYFVMELVQGIAITKYCDQHELSVGERLELFIPVCQAVQHAHQKGIIHRDIKPSNILVAEFDGRPVPKVIDFGVAKAIDQPVAHKQLSTQYGQIVGTLEYMSPEQARLSQHDVDTRSDVYSLGAVLYELLTGITPFDKDKLYAAAFDQALHMIEAEEPPKPSERLSSSDSLPSVAALRHIEPQRLAGLVRGELDWIVMKALEKDRTRRYDSASGLAQDIEHYLHDQPVLAGPPSAGYRLRTFARRNRHVLMVLAVLSLTLLIGTAASLYQAFRATAAERLAEARLGEVERQQMVLQKQQTALQAAKDTADQERKAAEGNLSVALDAVNEMLTQLASDKLQHMPPELTAVRVEMFARAQALVEQLASVNPTKRHIRSQLADGYRHLGVLADALGKHEDGEQALRKAIAVSEELSKSSEGDTSDTADVDLCSLQAECYYALGHLLRDLGRLDEARAAYGHIAEVMSSPQASRVPDDDRERWIGISHMDIARILNDENNYEAAGEEYKRALAIQESLLQRNGSFDNRQAVALTLFNLGGMRGQQQQFEDAGALTQRAISMFTNLLQELPSSTYLRETLALAYNNLGYVHTQTNKQDEAVVAFREHCRILEGLTVDFPSVPDHRDRFAVGCGNMAVSLKKSGNRGEAVQATKRAVETLRLLVEQHPAVPGYRVHLASYVRNLGNYFRDDQSWDAAIEHYREALRHNEAVYAQCPDVPEYAEYLVLSAVSLVDANFKSGGSDGWDNDVRHIAQIIITLFNANYGKTGTKSARTMSRIGGEFAWRFVVCPDAADRDPELALNLARALLKAEPEDGRLWETIGVAHFRKEEWRQAVEALEKSIGVRDGGTGLDLFILAICQHRLGNAEAASSRYAEGIRWLESQTDKDAELLQIRDDAARLLEIPPEQTDVEPNKGG